MSLHIIFSRVKNLLPGGLTPEAAMNYKSKRKIDWLVKFDGHLYVDVEKLRRWARFQGRLIWDAFEAEIVKWGCELEGQG